VKKNPAFCGEEKSCFFVVKKKDTESTIFYRTFATLPFYTKAKL